MRHRTTILVAALTLLGTTLVAATGGAQGIVKLSLNHANVPVQDPDCAGADTALAGSGTATIDYNANTITIDITHNVEGVTAAHIHGPAPIGGSASPVFSLSFTSSASAALANGTCTGTWNFSEADQADIGAGLYYVNMHTSACPNGAIRDQILAPPVPALGEWGLLLLALALAGVGGTFILRRRAALA